MTSPCDKAGGGTDTCPPTPVSGPRRVLVIRGGFGVDAALSWATSTLRPTDELTLSTPTVPPDLVVTAHRPGTPPPRTRVARTTVVVPSTWRPGRAPAGVVLVCAGHHVSPGMLAAALTEAERGGSAVVILTPFSGTSGDQQAALGEAAVIAGYLQRPGAGADPRQPGTAACRSEGPIESVVDVVRRQAAHVSLVVVNSAELHLSVPRRVVDVALDEVGIPVLLVPAPRRRSRSGR